jgi:hypothetical protein
MATPASPTAAASASEEMLN